MPLLIARSDFLMFLWGYQDRWMTLKFFIYLQFTRRPCGGSFHWTHLPWWFQAISNWQQGLPSTAMVNGTSQPHKSATLCVGNIVQQIVVSCQSYYGNNFGILKKTFQELMIKSNMFVHFFTNVIICCCMLHNMILNGKDANINELMQQLAIKYLP